MQRCRSVSVFPGRAVGMSCSWSDLQTHVISVSPHQLMKVCGNNPVALNYSQEMTCCHFRWRWRSFTTRSSRDEPDERTKLRVWSLTCIGPLTHYCRPNDLTKCRNGLTDVDDEKSKTRKTSSLSSSMKTDGGRSQNDMNLLLICVSFFKPLVSQSGSSVGTAGLWFSWGRRGSLQELCKWVISQRAPYLTGYASSSANIAALSKRSPLAPQLCALLRKTCCPISSTYTTHYRFSV